MNLFSVLEDAARKWPGEPAVVDDGLNFSYSDLCAKAQPLALELSRAGVRAGDKVGVVFPNGPEMIVAISAVLRAGGIVVPISSALKAPEIFDLACEMELDVFCYSAPFGALIPRSGGGVSAEVELLASRPPLVIRLTANRHGRSRAPERLLKMNPAWIRFSSGTTSKAKGIVMSHATLLERAELHAAAFSIEAASRSLWLWSTVDFLPVVLFASFMKGASVAFAGSMDAARLARILRAKGIARLYGTPMFYKEAASWRDVSAEDFRDICCISTGSALGDAAAQAFRARFDREILQFYGLSECGPVMINRNTDGAKRGALGALIPRCEAKLVSDEGGEAETGELLVRGPGMFDAYYKPWRPRDEVLEDGWFRTGDVAQRDRDGYYWIVGRVKDVINVGGTKVFPSEIEEVLLSHPAVEDTVVYGLREPRFGEAPHAKVKLKAGVVATERELLAHVNEKVSVFKALRGVEFVTEIPKTIAGKPRRAGPAS